jgi:hypothetical protein
MRSGARAAAGAGESVVDMKAVRDAAGADVEKQSNQGAALSFYLSPPAARSA